MIVLLGITAGWASPFDATFRIGHTTDFNGVALDVGDDYFPENGTYKARHAYVILYDETAVSWVAHYTDEDGEVLLTFVPGHTYHLTLLAQHDIGGRVLKIKDDVGGVVLSASTDPFTAASVDKFAVNDRAFLAAVDPWINVAAAASFAIWRRPAGFRTAAENGANYDIAMVDPGLYGASQAAAYLPTNADSQTVVIDPNDIDRLYAEKTTIVHELAHQMFHWAAYPGSGSVELYGTAALDDADDDTPCTDQPEGHQLNTKEYQSMAIQEGAAYWVAAVTFNKTTETDCRLLPGVGVDWHHTGGSFRDAFSCQGYPTDAGGVEWGFGIDGGDFLGDTHDPIGNTDPAFSCLDDDPVVDVSTDLDWLRFLWDLTTEGVLFADVVDAYGAAEPYDWDVEDARALLGYQLVNVSGYGNEWYTHDEPNGVHR